ncbi:MULTISPECIES: hypothetical protein [Clostridium]|uniref:Uncharacterized protein n=1 Tax=Clostridium cibarium TaxID=2762247 RepID=A0ABR8PTB4_9CLOT|nr:MULTISPECIES: hypothetical protein [Clostridium]MBD7911428.1 hypothetical protein [Clostridium cibarium]
MLKLNNKETKTYYIQDEHLLKDKVEDKHFILERDVVSFFHSAVHYVK